MVPLIFTEGGRPEGGRSGTLAQPRDTHLVPHRLAALIPSASRNRELTTGADRRIIYTLDAMQTEDRLMANSRIRREAMRLARAQIKLNLLKQGISVAAIDVARLNSMVYQMAQHDPEIRAKAAQNVASGIALPRHR